MTPANHEPLTIGEVVAQLRPEYEISESNLRFWEKQGLLAPQRTPGGHRLYSSADVARIKLIKRLQSSRYLPLSAIKHICAMEEQVTDEMAPVIEAFFRPRHYEAGFMPRTAAELAAETGLDLALIGELTAEGVLAPGSLLSEAEVRYDEDDRQICRLSVELAALGFPLEPIKQKAALVRQHVQDEWALVTRTIVPLLQSLSPQTKLKAKTSFEELEALLFAAARRGMREFLIQRGDHGPHLCTTEDK